MDENTIKTLQELIERTQKPTVAVDHATPFVLVPHGTKIESLEALLPAPTRKRGGPIFQRADSFCDYVNQQKTGASRLYVKPPTDLVAVLNHHVETGEDRQLAGWGDHRAQLKLEQTPEWLLWKSKNTVRFGQRDFAQFIADNSDDISAPVGADLIELIRTIKTSQNLEIIGEVDEKNDLKEAGFVVDAKTKAGARQEVELPDKFRLTIAPYLGGKLLNVDARLRIEISPPRFVLYYDLVKIQKIEQRAFDEIVADVSDETDIKPWYGQP